MITRNLNNFASSLINQLPLDVSNLQLDHFGYQSSSVQDYENLKQESLTIGNLISENIVSGRRVAIFKFIKPYKYKHYLISGFELIEPKKGQKCKSELNHLEFVIPISLDEFLRDHDNIQWSFKAKDRKEFPKISLDLENGKSVKFHTRIIFDEIP